MKTVVGVLAEVMTEVAIAELPSEDEPDAIVEGLADRGYQIVHVSDVDVRP